MAITSVSVNTIAGYISKGTLSNTYAATAVAALLDGNGNFQNCYESWIDSSIGYRMDSAVGSDLDSNVFCSFKFDPAILNGSSELIDLYDSTSNTSTALPTDNAGTWEGMAATTTAVAITQTTSWDVAGIGNITPTNTTTAAVNWPSATKTGTDYETRNGTTGKTFCFWYYPRTETPDAFLYQICDNTEDAATSGGNYSGVNIQRTSTIRLSFTVMMGNNGGTGSGNRRTHLGVRDSLTVNEWQFVVVRMISGSGQGVTSNYVNITLASAGVGARSQTNDGISGTSGTYNGAPVYNTSSSRALRFFNQRGSAGNLDDAIGQLWILPFGLDADDSILDDMFDATVGGYS